MIITPSALFHSALIIITGLATFALILLFPEAGPGL